MNQSQTAIQSNNTNTIKVKVSDLPLSCPPKEAKTWNLHPKVFLDFSKTGEACCPYCSNHFVLEK